MRADTAIPTIPATIPATTSRWRGVRGGGPFGTAETARAATTPALVATPEAWSTRETCIRTVRSETNRVLASSALEAPVARSVATSARGLTTVAFADGGLYVFLTDIPEAVTFITDGCPDWEQFE